MSDGNKWQQYVDQLLNVHYQLLNAQSCQNGASYQRVADRVQGDNGLEGFTTKGDAYQAYSDQAHTTKERTAGQKRKITTDLKKLSDFKDFWIDTLNGLKLRTWTLVVPRYEDKKVMQHARRKAKQVREAGLSFIADDFEVLVKTDEDFPLARGALARQGEGRLSLNSIEPTPNDIEQYQVERPDLVQRLDTKLGRVPGLESVPETREEFLQWYLHSENALENLRRVLPDVWAEINNRRHARARMLGTESRFNRDSPNERILATKNAFALDLEGVAPILNVADRDTIAMGTVAGWLLECPLNFPEQKNG